MTTKKFNYDAKIKTASKKLTRSRLGTAAAMATNIGAYVGLSKLKDHDEHNSRVFRRLLKRKGYKIYEGPSRASGISPKYKVAHLGRDGFITGHELGHHIDSTKKGTKHVLASSMVGRSAITVPVSMVVGYAVGKQLARDEVKGKKTPWVIKHGVGLTNALLQAPVLASEATASARSVALNRRLNRKRSDKNKRTARHIGKAALALGTYGANAATTYGTGTISKHRSYISEMKRLKNQSI